MMGKIQEINTDYGRIEVTLLDNCVMLTEYRGKDISITIPEQIENKPVTVIGKKAFLGAKSLRELYLPESITEIREWAFASCSGLEKLSLPRKELNIGQGILKDCVKLEQIVLTDGSVGLAESETEGTSRLLAAVMNKLDAFYLFDTVAAGSRQWLEQWDARMMLLMTQEDTEGFSKMLLCGEEDYGSRENNLDYYVEQRKRFKVRLAILRLMYDDALREEVKASLYSYLRTHTKGQSSEETWKVVLEEHGDDKKYYQFLLDNECITAENINAVLEDMGERHTEMKAFLMNCQSTQMKKADAFAGLEW